MTTNSLLIQIESFPAFKMIFGVEERILENKTYIALVSLISFLMRIKSLTFLFSPYNYGVNRSTMVFKKRTGQQGLSNL